MNEATIIAIIVLCGIFLVLLASIIRYGIESTLKLWNGMGALTGLAFGSIISFYFTDQANQAELSQFRAEIAGISENSNAIAQQLDNATSTLDGLIETLPSLPDGLESSENFTSQLDTVEQDLERIENFNRAAESAIEAIQEILP